MPNMYPCTLRVGWNSLTWKLLTFLQDINDVQWNLSLIRNIFDLADVMIHKQLMTAINNVAVVALRSIWPASVLLVLPAITHLEDELSESIGVFVIEQQSVAGVCCSRFKEEQEDLVSGRTALKKAEQQLEKPTQLQHTTTTTFSYLYTVKAVCADRILHCFEKEILALKDIKTFYHACCKLG